MKLDPISGELFSLHTMRADLMRILSRYFVGRLQRNWFRYSQVEMGVLRDGRVLCWTFSYWVFILFSSQTGHYIIFFSRMILCEAILQSLGRLRIWFSRVLVTLGVLLFIITAVFCVLRVFLLVALRLLFQLCPSDSRLVINQSMQCDDRP